MVRRVVSAKVSVSGNVVGSIDDGLIVLLGIHRDDVREDLDWLVQKIVGLRIFEDSEGKMNTPISANHGMLLISQFTLLGNLAKGYRPSFNRAADSLIGENLYNKFFEEVKAKFSGTLAAGVFGQDMKITAVDDGPVTIWLDSHNRKY